MEVSRLWEDLQDNVCLAVIHLVRPQQNAPRQLSVIVKFITTRETPAPPNPLTCASVTSTSRARTTAMYPLAPEAMDSSTSKDEDDNTCVSCRGPLMQQKLLLDSTAFTSGLNIPLRKHAQTQFSMILGHGPQSLRQLHEIATPPDFVTMLLSLSFKETQHVPR